MPHNWKQALEDDAILALETPYGGLLWGETLGSIDLRRFQLCAYFTFVGHNEKGQSYECDGNDSRSRRKRKGIISQSAKRERVGFAIAFFSRPYLNGNAWKASQPNHGLGYLPHPLAYPFFILAPWAYCAWGLWHLSTLASRDKISGDVLRLMGGTPCLGYSSFLTFSRGSGANLLWFYQKLKKRYAWPVGGLD